MLLLFFILYEYYLLLLLNNVIIFSSNKGCTYVFSNSTPAIDEKEWEVFIKKETEKTIKKGRNVFYFILLSSHFRFFPSSFFPWVTGGNEGFFLFDS